MLKGFLENVDEKLTDGEYQHLFSYKKALNSLNETYTQKKCNIFKEI